MLRDTTVAKMILQASEALTEVIAFDARENTFLTKAKNTNVICIHSCIDGKLKLKEFYPSKISKKDALIKYLNL